MALFGYARGLGGEKSRSVTLGSRLPPPKVRPLWIKVEGQALGFISANLAFPI
jgi:hypothetical protein